MVTLKSWIIRAFVVFGLVLPAQAELLLFKRGLDGNNYYPIDSQTFQKETPNNQNEIKIAFKEILMVFQWPMIAAHFFEQSEDVKEDYLNALQMDHGTTLFIQNTLDKKFGKGAYKVHFVPTTIFELAAINSFMEYIINSKDLPIYGGNRSIFPIGDIRNGDFITKEFKDLFAGDIIKGLRTYQGKPNADLLTMKNACEVYNQSAATFDMFLQTTSYLVNKFKEDISIFDPVKDKVVLRKILVDLLEHHNKIEDSFDKNLEIKEKGLWGDRYNGKTDYNINKIKYISGADIDSLVKGAELDCQVEQKNQFVLLRGTAGFQVGNSKIIDSPYRESAEDYAEALKDWPESLIRKFLPITIKSEPSHIRDTFYPVSLSYGNSLMAGTFFEASNGGGARTLDYMRSGSGYALLLPIAEFFRNTTTSSLHQKYYISALHPLVALFTKGEYFHSRSKISLFDPKKKLAGYGGFKTLTDSEASISYLDRATHAGLIVTSGVDWPTLRSSISQDIAHKVFWIKEPSFGDASKWVETQRNFAQFSSFEIAAFMDHFLNFKPVLEQIKNPDLRQSSLNPIFGSKIQTLSIPETSPEKREYNSNVFTKIIENPANQNTTPIIDMSHSMSFNDIQKRTKEHALIVPKGNYISFSHFIDFAKPEEIEDLMRAVANTAKKLDIAESGYRIITNNSLNPGQNTNNNAEQEIPHFHIHLAGGECLGLPVAGSHKIGELRDNIDMTIRPHPFGADWTPEQLYRYANAHKIGKREIKIQDNKKRLFLAYQISESANLGVKQLIGFLVFDDKRQSAYPSIHAFAETASAEEIRSLFKFINDVSRKVGIYNSGFRVISDFGNDASQFPKNVMTIIIAGGNTLGITVTNMYGNHKIWEGGSSIYDYKHLNEYPHPHCAANAHDTYQLFQSIKTNVPENLKKTGKEKILNLDFYEGDVLKALSEVPDPKVIRKLNLEGNDLTEFPEVIGNFTELEELNLADNNLTSLSNSMKNLKKLKELRLQYNKFESFPDVLINLKNIEELYLMDNLLTSLPESIGSLRNLVTLNLNNNKLTMLPESIGSLRNLKKFNLNNNSLTTLPDSVGELNKLTELRLDANQIQDLPGSLENLKETLSKLVLSDNNDLIHKGENGRFGETELKGLFGKRVVW